MRSVFRLIVASVSVAALTACLSPSEPASFGIVWPIVDGPYRAQVTRDDIWQIVQLARHRSDIELPVTNIDVLRPDEAHVFAGNEQKRGALHSEFDVHRRDGRWIIVEASVKSWRPEIILDHPIKTIGLTNRCSQPLAA